MEALGINGGYFLVQLVNFFTILVVLRVWVYTPILGLLEKRRATIAKGLKMLVLRRMPAPMRNNRLQKLSPRPRQKPPKW